MALQEYKILGAKCLAVTSVKEYEQHINQIIQSKKAGYSVAINAEKVMFYQNNEAIKEIIDNSILPSPDGAGALLGLKLLHGKSSLKIDLPKLSLKIANDNQYKLYVLGASQEVNQKAVQAIQSQFPNIHLVGNNDGYFKNENKIIETIVAQQPQIIMVALGTPKQEILAQKINKLLPSALIIGCGGALDVLAGKVKRAPIIFQKMHLEWFYRLVSNPTRIKRQKVLPIFLLKVLWASLKK